LISLFTPLYLLFLYNALSPTIIYTLSLHDALPIYREYVTPSGRLVSSTQTAYVLALQFDMLPQELRQQAAKRLVQNIESYNNHLDRKSTRLNSSHVKISYAVFCLKKKRQKLVCVLM